MSLRNLMAVLAAIALLSAAATTAALANSVKIGALSLTDLWTRATPPKAPTAGGYLTIENAGNEPDRLTAVASPIAGQAMIHAMSTRDGTMTMRPAKGGIEIPAGGKVALSPGGVHIMFMDLKETLAEGGKVPVTLTFEKAGSIDTFLHVLGIGARGPEGGEAHSAEHGSGQ